jgi:TolB-like protein/Tfp pilus assembly protein PilF
VLPLPHAWRERKLTQWSLAYLTGAWLIYEVLSLVSANFAWPVVVIRCLSVLLALGLPATLIVAWYHGDKGRQHVSGPELVMMAALLFIAAAAVALVAGAAQPAADGLPVTAVDADARSDRGVASPKSIAVLPFQSLSDDAGDAYFADGIHEDILTHLSKVRDLKVISRTSVLRYRNDRQNLRQIGRELGVATILEGSVRRARDRVRITAQLIDARTDEQLWAQNYDREITDIFEIQSEVAQRIVAALRVNLTAVERARIEMTPTIFSQAYDFYLQAREYHLRPGNERQDLLSAEHLYLRALEADPEFALAYARLAHVHTSLYWYAHDRSEERLLRARSMMHESLRLDPHLPEAHTAAAYYHYWGERDYARAQADLEIALAALPGSGELHAVIGFLHRRRGEWETAADRLRRSLELDPRNADVLRNLAQTLELMKQYPAANRYYTEALNLAPDHHVAALHRAFLFLRWQGTTDSMRAVLARLPIDFEPTLGLVPVAPRVQLALLRRDPDEALRLLAASRRNLYEHQRYYYPASLLGAFAHALRGDSVRAALAYDSARVILEAARVRRPDDARVHSALGLAYAGLARRADAVRAGRRAVEILPIAADAMDGAVYAIELAAIYAQVGDTRNAVAEIERLLRTPAGLSVHELRLDPRWDPLRKVREFVRLIGAMES